MKSIIKLAFKNLTRYKKRTFLTCIAIAFGIAMLIWIDGMLIWADNESKRNLKRYEFGNFIISSKEFKEDRKNFPLNSVIEKSQINKVFDIAKKTGCSAAPRTGFKSMLSFDRGYGLPYIVMAIEPLLDAQVFSIKENIVKGSYLESKDSGVLIGVSCAKDLGVQLGDFILMETRTRYNTYQAIDLKVVGIFDCPDPVVNRNQVFITQDLANRQLQAEGTVTEIAFRTPGGDNEPALNQVKKELLSTGLTNLVIETWQELGSDFIGISQTKRGGSSIIIFFIFVIVAVGIINTMLMAVFERVREIGMIRALGMRDSAIVLSFIIEAAGIGLIGSLLGLLLGIGLDVYSIYVGIDFTSIMADMDMGYRVGTVWYNEWNPKMMITSVIFGILCSILVSIIPARKAVKMEITDSIRYI